MNPDLAALLDLYSDLHKGDVSLGEKGRSFASLDLYSEHQDIEEALTDDPTGETAAFLVYSHILRNLQTTSLSMEDIICLPPEAVAQLDIYRKAYALLNKDSLTDLVADFKADLSASLLHYASTKRLGAALEVLLEDDDSLFRIRACAYRSLNNLHVHKFLSGEAEPEGVKPAYMTTVMQWWNVNALLKAATTMPSGISLHYIRSPDDSDHYFAFIIKDGSNLYLLSDSGRLTRPLDARRTNASRFRNRRIVIGQPLFPYDLFSTPLGKSDGAESRGLRQHHLEGNHASSLADLAPETLVWLSLLFDKLVETYWGREDGLALSYTANAIKQHLEHDTDTMLPVVSDQPLELDPMTVDAVSDAFPDPGIFGNKINSNTDWLIARYASKINPATLALVQIGNTDPVDATLAALLPENIVITGHASHRKIVSLTSPLELKGLKANEFGSKAELDADRHYIARYNLAKQITALANQECFARYDEINEWYESALLASQEHLFNLAANGRVDSTIPLLSGHFGSYHNGINTPRISGNDPGRDSLEYTLLNTEANQDRPKRALFNEIHNGVRCPFTGARASYSVYFNPASADDLALLLNMAISELPDVLQHWDSFDHYSGNTGTSRVDPMEWVAKDPWTQIMDFRFGFAVSKRGYKQLLANASPLTLPEGFSCKAR